MPELSSEQAKHIIAKNIAANLKPNSYVNLGLGVPTLTLHYLKPEQNIIIHAENGLIGTKGDYTNGEEEADPNVISSSGYPTRYITGSSFFDSSLSFGIIRGKHLDAAVLGTIEVDQEGNIANYLIPGKLAVGMGGAMDLCVGAKSVIVATTLTNKGKPKILKKCRIPLTAPKAVNTIVTEKAIFEVQPNGQPLLLVSYNPMFKIKDIIAEVEADVEEAKDLNEMIID